MHVGRDGLGSPQNDRLGGGARQTRFRVPGRLSFVDWGGFCLSDHRLSPSALRLARAPPFPRPSRPIVGLANRCLQHDLMRPLDVEYRKLKIKLVAPIEIAK